MRKYKYFFDFLAILTFALHLFLVSSKTIYYSTVTAPRLRLREIPQEQRQQKGGKAMYHVAQDSTADAALTTQHSPHSTIHDKAMWISSPSNLSKPALLSTAPRLLLPGLPRERLVSPCLFWFPSTLFSTL